MRPHSIRFTGLARALRGAVLGAAALLITGAGHAAGYGGSMPDTTALVLLVPLFVVLATALGDRRVKAATLLAYVIGMQVLGHTLLVVGFDHSGHGSGGASLVPGGQMLVGHAVATALVLLVLLYGEDVLHRWLRFFADLTRTWVAPHSPLLAGATTSWTQAPEPTLRSEFAASVQRRGPPTNR